MSAFTTCGQCKRQADHYTIANGRCICAECKDLHRQSGTCWRCAAQLHTLKEHERAECARCFAEVVA